MLKYISFTLLAIAVPVLVILNLVHGIASLSLGHYLDGFASLVVACGLVFATVNLF